MPWNAKIDPSGQIVELTYSEIVTPAELNAALLAAVALSKQHHTNLFLADCSGMIGGHSVSDLYFLIEMYVAAGLSRDVREALVLPALKSTAEEVRFYETACFNRGFNVKVFPNTQDARSWLDSWKKPD